MRPTITTIGCPGVMFGHPTYGDVAQLAEQRLDKTQAGGSKPPITTNGPWHGPDKHVVRETGTKHPRCG